MTFSTLFSEPVSLWFMRKLDPREVFMSLGASYNFNWANANNQDRRPFKKQFPLRISRCFPACLLSVFICRLCLFVWQDDFLLIHYDKGPCRNKLGHSRASVIWHRTQVRWTHPAPPTITQAPPPPVSTPFHVAAHMFLFHSRPQSHSAAGHSYPQSTIRGKMVDVCHTKMSRSFYQKVVFVFFIVTQVSQYLHKEYWDPDKRTMMDGWVDGYCEAFLYVLYQL